MSYTVYSDVLGGSAVDGSTAVNAALINSFRAFCLAGWFDSAITSNGSGILTALGAIINGAIAPNPSSTVLNGSTSGTATLWQPLTGTAKLIILIESSFRNGGGSAQTITIPTPFVSAFRWWTGDTNTMTFKSGATTQNVGVITALAAAGGTVTVQTNVGSYSIGDCGAACDTISFSSGAGSAHTGIQILAGI